MYRRHSKEIINNIKKLRKNGSSINELVVKFGVSKTTIWHHIHGIKMSDKKKKIIRSKQGGSKKRKELNILKAQEKAKEILSFPNPYRELAIIVSMLYWAEGSKKVCEFINSDGRMIAIYLFIIRDVFKIKELYIQPTMRVFTGMDQDECLRYWSRITNILPEKFVVRLNDGGTKCRTRYGMCRITIKKGQASLKLLLALIDSVFEEVVKLGSVKMPS